MSREEILSSIEALSPDEQYSLACSILDSLAVSGKMTLSDVMRAEIRRRDSEFETNPHQGESWESVKKEVFGA